MKQLLPLIFILFTHSFFAQVWNQLPSVPEAPANGTVGAEAGDLIMTDDGRIYTSFIWNDGSTTKLYIKEYVPGSGWSSIHSEQVYFGLQPVKSRKMGNDAYVICKVGNSSSNPLFKVFKLSEGNVDMISSFQLGDYTNGSYYDFEMGSEPDNGFLLHKNALGLTLNLSTIDYYNNSVSTQSLPLLSAISINNFDMTVAGDTIYMAVDAVILTERLYLLKKHYSSGSIVPYSSSSADGQVTGSGGSAIVCRNIMLNSNGDNEVYLTGYNQTANQLFERRYSNNVLSGLTTSGNVAQNNSNGNAVGNTDKLYYFNNFGATQNGSFSTYVLAKDLATGTYDSIGTDGTYLLSGSATSGHRISSVQEQNRVAASFYSTAAGNRLHYISNDLPFIAPENIDQTAGMCLGESAVIFNSLGITDLNSDALEVLEILSSDNSILHPDNIEFEDMGQDGILSNYYMTGTADAAGTVTLTLKITDGWDTVLLELPPINVVSGGGTSFLTSAIHICSDQGMVNLFDYVSLTGGTFYINSLEYTFENGLYNTNASPIEPGEDYTLSYEVDGVCYLNSNVDIYFHTSPTVNITSMPTLCAMSTGSATALVNGGATPYQSYYWSNGVQNSMNVSGLAAGQHGFTVIDANTCNVTKYFEVAITGASLSGVVQDASCYGTATGSIAVTPSGLQQPLSMLWSSGNGNLTLNNAPAGDYTINVMDATGCSLSATYTINQPAPLVTETYSNRPNCLVSDGSIGVTTTTGGTAPYTYAWNNGVTTPDNMNVPGGIYSLTTTDAHGCMAINTIYLSEIGSADLYGSITGTNCGAAEGAIDVDPYLPSGEDVLSISWSNGAETEDIGGLAPANYVCTFVTTNNCTAIKGWNIPIVAPERNPICVVTVDSATTTNLVVWEKVQPVGIAYYNIYRETSIQGNFQLIDTVHADNLSVFNDVVASPLVRSWRYKIAAVNACDVVGPLSAPHQTIHLDVLDNGGTEVIVSWNAYQGTAFDNYIVSRYSDLTGMWEEIATVPVTQLSYTDNTPFATPGLDYMVEMDLSDWCTATIWRAQDFNSSRSNKDKGQFSTGQGTGNSNNGIAEHEINVSVYPNPFSAIVTIAAENVNGEVPVRIFSVDGQEVASGTVINGFNKLDLSHLHAGMYLLKVGNNEQVQQLVKF